MPMNDLIIVITYVFSFISIKFKFVVLFLGSTFSAEIGKEIFFFFFFFCLFPLYSQEQSNLLVFNISLICYIPIIRG